MNELMSKWIEALESGKYKQGFSLLRKINNGKTKHCCLGVLCEESGTGTWTEAGTMSMFSMFKSDGTLALLAYKPPPELVIEAFGLDKIRVMTANEIIDKLIDMNDLRRYDFARIAELLREKPIEWWVS